MGDEPLSLRAWARADEIGPLRERVVAYAEQFDIGDELRDALRLAVSEALTNVAVHAYVDQEPGELVLEAWRDEDDHLAVVVWDEGRGLVPNPNSRGLGLGFALMAQMASDFTISNREQTPGTIVSLRFALVDRAPCLTG